MPRPKKKTEDSVTLTIKVPTEVNHRILAFTSEKRATELNKSQVARAALLIGLEILERDPGRLAGLPPTK